jgi:hypothetical protein
MSSKYQSDALVIPEGFPALLKGFAREVLRSQVRSLGVCSLVTCSFRAAQQ